MDSREPREDHELAACPFCGGERVAAVSIRDGMQGKCSACHAAGPPAFHGRDGDTRARAIAAWNRRPSPVAESGEYVVDPQPEIAGAPISKIVSYNQAHEDAVEMGYPSLTEALEHLSELRSPVAESTPTDATAVEAERETLTKAIEPVRHWYESDEHPPRELAAIVTDIVADLQEDRAEVLRLRKAERLAESTPSIRDAVADGEGEKIARRLEVLMAFLLGTGPLAGCHFGERPANINGNFWWRKEVRSFLTEAIAALRTAQNTGRDEVLEEAAKAKNVYLAARFSRRHECHALAKQLQALGYRITSRWVKPEADHVLPVGISAQAADDERRRFATEDCEDVREAGWMISLMEEPRNNSRGGRHIEFGMAVALGHRLTIIGPRETVFHHLPEVEHFDSVEQFLAALSSPPVSTVDEEGGGQ